VFTQAEHRNWTIRIKVGEYPEQSMQFLLPSTKAGIPFTKEFLSPRLEFLSQLPEANPIIEDEFHFLGSCSRYQSMRASIKEPTKTLLINGT
jgi:hypothetical protein